MSISFDKFISIYLGKGTDFDGAAGVQCVDLIKMYIKHCQGVTPQSIGNAHRYYERYDELPYLNKLFIRIPNTASFVPQKEDICVWNTNVGGGCGHVSIATGEGNTKYFYSYDQNWKGKALKKVKHTYKNFYGVLRPRRITSTTLYVPGTYIVKEALNVRKGAGGNFDKVYYSQFTANAKKQVKKLDSACPNYFPAGTKVSITEVDGTWGKCPSGWISLKYCRKAD